MFLKRAVVDPDVHHVPGEVRVIDFRPGSPPCFQGFRRSPVGGGNRIEKEYPVRVLDSVPVFVKTIYTFLL